MKTLLLTPTPEVRRRVEPVLRSRGHDVTACAGGAEALDALASAPFELVVVDLTAPGLDGPGVCRRLRDAPGGEWYVVLVVTASRHTHPLAEALRLGADDCLLLVEEREWEELLNLRLTIAGHPPLLLVGSGGALSSHPATGPLLGCFEGAEFAEGELTLGPGDRLFLYSDGVTEAFHDSGVSSGRSGCGAASWRAATARSPTTSGTSWGRRGGVVAGPAARRPVGPGRGPRRRSPAPGAGLARPG